ncbi:MAG: NAD-dependent epimerase/dehydratase family protein [Silvanigrellales bacterium]|nr:NAD-dependent epimerase/dehydratase family protein [Silvanigrellales bacterium]
MSPIPPRNAPLIVVTGSNGFIGTHIVEALLKRSFNDLTSPGARPRTARLRFSNFEDDAAQSVSEKTDSDLPRSHEHEGPLFVVGADLPESVGRSNAARFAGSARYRFVGHVELLSKLESGELAPVAIVHNGACSSTVETDPAVFATLNVEYSKRLWNIAAKLNIPFLYASSAAVYGDGEAGFSDAVEDCGRFAPLNLYGHSKLDFDLWALAQAQRPFRWFGLRYFNVYGPFETHKEGQASMVLHGYRQVTRTGEFRLFESNSKAFGHGEQKRDFLFVDDITRYTLLLLSESLRAKKAWAQGTELFPVQGQGLFVNLGTGVARSWNDLARGVFAALGLPERIVYIPMPESLSRQYQNYTQARHTGLERLGLPVAFTDLAQGVRTYVQRYLMRGL